MTQIQGNKPSLVDIVSSDFASLLAVKSMHSTATFWQNYNLHVAQYKMIAVGLIKTYSQDCCYMKAFSTCKHANPCTML